MSEVPKIVRQKLAAGQQGTGAHPEADLLAALAEQRLAGEERERVLAHLAQCAECREVAALAAPQQEPTQTVVRPVRRRFWLFQPNVLRWGALAASVAVVAVAVAVYGPRQQRHATMTTERAASAPSQNVTGEVRVEQQPSETKQAAEATPPPAKDQRLEARAKTAAPIARPDESADKRKDERAARDQVATFPASKAAPPSVVGEMAAKQAAAPASATTMADQAAPMLAGGAGRAAENEVSAGPKPSQATVHADSAAVQAQAAQPAANMAMRKAAAPPPAAAESVAVTGGAVSKKFDARSEAKLSRELAQPLWSISKDGEVQASLTGGRSWQTINVAKGVRFLAVSASGADVWAGGGGGALYHSKDAGAKWQQVPLGTDEDIVRIQFKDAQHGTVTTASGAQWTTEDGGKTWKAGQ